MHHQVSGDGDIIAMVCTDGQGFPTGMITPTGMGILLGIPEGFRRQRCPSMNGHPGEQVQLLVGVGIFTTANSSG